MATRDNLYQRIGGSCLIAFVVAALCSCAVKHKVAGMQPVVWRASESNGDKPGVGYEIVEATGGISGFFLLFDPAKPIDFETGVRVPMTITKVSTNEYRATVRYPSGEVDELSIRFEAQREAFTRKAVIQELNRPSSPGDFTFVRKQ